MSTPVDNNTKQVISAIRDRIDVCYCNDKAVIITSEDRFSKLWRSEWLHTIEDTICRLVEYVPEHFVITRRHAMVQGSLRYGLICDKEELLNYDNFVNARLRLRMAVNEYFTTQRINLRLLADVCNINTLGYYSHGLSVELSEYIQPYFETSKDIVNAGQLLFIAERLSAKMIKRKDYTMVPYLVAIIYRIVAFSDKQGTSYIPEEGSHHYHKNRKSQ